MAAPPQPATMLAPEEKQSLEAAWEDAFVAFRKAANIDLLRTRAPTADDIRASFDSKRSKDAEKHRKMELAKDAFSKTMTCISRVGGIAASGASMVFGSPASIAGSALTFFIDVGLQYKNMFANIEDLLSQIVVVFERFQIYRDNEANLPPEMIRVAHKLLITVVEICGVCYKALKSNKLATFGKLAFFSTDRGVQSQLERLKRIESEESKTQGTLNLVLAAENKKSLATGFEKTTEGLQSISGSVQGVQDELKNQKVLKELKAALSIGKETSYREQYLRYYSQVSEESNGEFCDWLHEDSMYQAWSDADNAEHTSLILSGEQGFGKTCTVTAIIDDLTKRYPQQQQDTSRVSVAYMYVSGTGKNEAKTEAKSEGGVTLSDVVRLLAWQVAQNDVFYRRDLTSICKRNPNLGTTQEMWKSLFLDCAEEEATFYLIIDGIQELDSKERETLAQLVKMMVHQPHTSLCIKLLLASRSDFVENLNSKLATRLAEIKLATRTKADIERSIRREAKGMAIFQRQTDSVKKLKASVCEGLAEAVGGSFLNAEFLLREISGKNDPQEVMEIVERAKSGDGVSGSIADMIKRCNQKLGSRELQDLNTLLLWVMYGEWTFDLDECEAIIFLQRDSSSLKPLGNQIKDDFSGFFSVDSYDSVRLVNENIETYFKSLASDQGSASAQAAKSVSKNEIKMVRNFILKFCEDDVYERMGLNTFFDQKLSESDTTIAVDCDNAHALITIDCLRVLVNEPCPDTDGIVYYAARFLVSHMKNLDLDGVNPHYKGEIGPLLTSLLRDARPLDTTTRGELMASWSYNDDVPKEAVRLMQSSAVMKKIMATPGDTKDWVTSVLESDQPEIDILAPMAVVRIKQWIECNYVVDNLLAFTWIFGYYNKIKHTENPQTFQRAEECPDLADISADLVRDIFEWAQTKTSIDIEAANTLRNLGLTYRECGELDEAIESLEAAIALQKDYLYAYCNLSKAYADRSEKNHTNEWRKAIESANRVIEATTKGEDVIDKGDAELWLARMRLLSAQYNCNLKAYDEAEKIYLTILEKDPQEYEAVTGLIVMMCEQERWGDVVKLIHALDQQLQKPDPGEEPLDPPRTRLSVYLGLQSMDDEHRGRIVNAFKKAGELSLVKQHYQKVLRGLEKETEQHTQQSLWLYGTVTLNLAALLHHHAVDVDEADQAVQLWEKLIAMSGPTRSLIYPKYVSSQYLSAVYLTRAIQARASHLDADDMVTKIEQLGGDDEDDSWGLSRDIVRSMIGRYFTAVDDAEHAREWLKPNVEVGVKLLSDDDPTNDYQGYRKLGDAFMDFGDLVNAVAAWTMIGPQEGLEVYEQKGSDANGAETGPNGTSTGNGVTNGAEAKDNNKSDEETNGTTTNKASASDDAIPLPKLTRARTWQVKSKLSGPLNYRCDGRWCGKEWTYADDIYICRECIDVQFDEGCLAKLRAGELGRDICSREHRFMHLPPWDAAAYERVKAERVQVGDQQVPFDDWMASICKEWGIENEKKAASGADKANDPTNGVDTAAPADAVNGDVVNGKAETSATGPDGAATSTPQAATAAG